MLFVLVQDEVPEFVQGIEIARNLEFGARSAGGTVEQFCPEGTRRGVRATWSRIVRIGAELQEIAAGHRAIEANVHQAARLQSPEQGPPAAPGIGHVVQHPNALDNVELALQSVESEDV